MRWHVIVLPWRLWNRDLVIMATAGGCMIILMLRDCAFFGQPCTSKQDLDRHRQKCSLAYLFLTGGGLVIGYQT
jgi:hypothetical protein